jgi:hypothetical protein
MNSTHAAMLTSKNQPCLQDCHCDLGCPESLADKMPWKWLPNKFSFFLFYSEYSHFKKVVTLQQGGNADRRTFRESNAYFDRHATTTKQKSEPSQELKQYVIVIFNRLYKIRLSPRQPDNDPDLAIRNNRSYLIETRRITNIAHIFGFNTLF